MLPDFLYQSFQELNIPLYHFILEIFLISILVFLYYKKSFPINPNDYKLRLTKKEEQKLIDEWLPEPLITENWTKDSSIRSDKIITSKPSEKITINGIECTNFATLNFYGFINNSIIEKDAIETVEKYGVGTCGPRGFYGTNNIHLELESQLSNFLKVEAAIIYSYGTSCISSSIPAYIKCDDYAFVDETANYNILIGLRASKANVIFYAKNNLNDLETKIKMVFDKQSRNRKKFNALRFFIVVEAVSYYFGNIIDLKELIRLKNKYKVRIFIDESLSFGILGETGRGITEYSGIDPNTIDLIMVNLESTFSTIGGFCAGSKYVINHQVLSGMGYCFSASLPGYLAKSAITALNILQETPKLITNLNKISIYLYKFLIENIPKSFFYIDGQPGSPIFHIRFLPGLYNNEEQIDRLCRFEDMCINKYKLAFNIFIPQNEHMNEFAVSGLTTTLSTSEKFVSFDNLSIGKGKFFSYVNDNDDSYINNNKKYFNGINKNGLLRNKSKLNTDSYVSPSIVVPINTSILDDAITSGALENLFEPLIKCLESII